MINRYGIVLPDPHTERRSAIHHCDAFYSLPKEIECFIARANQELPYGWAVKPWTLNRAVSIFHRHEFAYAIPYEEIEGGIVVMLNDVVLRAVANTGWLRPPYLPGLRRSRT